jgi:hypothetical protein
MLNRKHWVVAISKQPSRARDNMKGGDQRSRRGTLTLPVHTYEKVDISTATESPGHTGPKCRRTRRWLGHRYSMITQTTWWMLVATREQMQQCKEHSCRVAWRFSTWARQSRGKKHLVWGSMTSPSSSSGSGVLPRAHHPPPLPALDSCQRLLLTRPSEPTKACQERETTCRPSGQQQQRLTPMPKQPGHAWPNQPKR